jgi:2-polyprenyl-3-methyl-5-hydroxy-6-metoxy-1,4-benzoquinol methylase
MANDHDRLTFDDFRARATEPNRTANEKIGFPDSYRSGAEGAIFADVSNKLPALNGSGRTIVDIGCGCGPLAHLLIAHCAQKGHRLVMVDSPEMLALLPASPGCELRPQRFPHDAAFLAELGGKADAVLVYSVIQHEFMSGDLWGMFDAVCGLLADDGRALLGDIPNRSMRTRLFQSRTGENFHRTFTGSDSPPPVPPPGAFPGEIDDSVVVALLLRARAQGLHAYVMPQPDGLPFANRREDVVLHHP